MKQANIIIGATYETYIGQTLARVVVLGSYPPGRYEKHMRFRVRREGETKELPKHRTAAALRLCARTRTPEAYSEIQDYIDAEMDKGPDDGLTQ
jgi:hypothetical protein